MSVRRGELEHLVLPLVSIDEYSAKAGKDAEVIVVGFFCREEMAAWDLDDFIDKGVLEVLSSDVSPNPDPDGYWLVFVEFRRRPSFWAKLAELIADVENVTTQLKWRVRVYGSDQLYAPEDQALRDTVPLSPEEYILNRQDRELSQYFESSALDGFRSGDGVLTFESGPNQLHLELKAWVDRESGLEHPILREAQWNPLSRNSQARVLTRMLGQGWTVTAFDRLLLIEHAHQDHMVIAKC